MYERLYEEMERATIQFVGYASDRTRFDLCIVFTEQFFGKPIVICMQTGKSTLLCLDDLHHLEHLQAIFSLGPKEAEELSEFLRQHIPSIAIKDEF
ncbi:hypothetical protein J31TS4_30260 [Paenibacillus sp. J31TS4]|uniref:SAV0927 family protein n=1 Tax=Paenibacillus sp. J31TS4 TaxID=2807195 RepID=UPI001B2DFCFD|nr:SAV0927 family protein [Paenibacillus sp. J31TS4]GIP39746.1 hypothetical protein J31TS4_30260 [Paenibacillus sp. J31TS4]